MRENAIHEKRNLAPKKRTPARSWEAFERDLAAALETLDDEYVIVSAKGGNRFVQFDAQPSLGLRAEVVSNAFLEGNERLADDQIAALSALGWSPPTGKPAETTPEKQPQGSPNFFRGFPKPVPYEEVARMAVRTLADVLRIAGPGHLEYSAFDRAGHPLCLPKLHLADAPPPPPTNLAPASPNFENFRLGVRDAVCAFFHRDSLDFDADGDIPLKLEYAVAYLRVRDNPLRVRAFCQLAPKVNASDPRALQALNEINVKLALGHLVLSNGGLYGSVDILVPPFVADHLLPALGTLSGMAARFAHELRAVLADPAGSDEMRPEPLKN